MSTNGRPIPPMTEADQRRFWAKVKLPDERGCMEWTAGKSSSGYGRFRLGDAVYQAHRISWTLENGEIPPGKVLDHLCRNKTCVAPGHLEAVDNRTNILRGESFSAENAKRTRCPAGHAYDEANTYRDPRGFRQCRACRREWIRAHRLRKRLASTDSTGQLPMPTTSRTGLDAS